MINYWNRIISVLQDWKLSSKFFSTYYFSTASLTVNQDNLWKPDTGKWQREKANLIPQKCDENGHQLAQRVEQVSHIQRLKLLDAAVPGSSPGSRLFAACPRIYSLWYGKHWSCCFPCSTQSFLMSEELPFFSFSAFIFITYYLYTILLKPQLV